MNGYYWSNRSPNFIAYWTDSADDSWVYLYMDSRRYVWDDAHGTEQIVDLPEDIKTLEEAKAYIETLVRMNAM